MLVGLSLWFCYLHFLLPGGFLTVGAFAPAQDQFSHGQQTEYNAQKPMARHKNHCAYVVDKMVSFTVQEGVTPVMKAEYNKCDWGEKCPNVKYRMYYKPKYKVAHKTVTELKWKCCPGYAGVGCTAAYGGKARPPFKGAQPAQKGPLPSFNNGLRPAQKGPASSFNEQMPAQKGPMPPFKGPRPAQNGPMHSLKRPMPAQKSPMSSFKGPMPMQKNPASSFQRPFPSQQGPGPFFKGPNASQRGPTPFQKGPMPSHKGPMPYQKGPMPYQKGPMPYQKGPMPPFKGQTPQTKFNGNHWNQPNVPSNGMNRYPDPNPGPSSQDSSVDPYAEPQEPDVDYPEPIPEPQDLGHEIIPDENEPITDFRDPHPVLHGMIPEHGEVDSIPGAQTPSGGQSTNQVHEDDVENERLDRMEEDVQRISIGLETLRGTVTSLEDNLRTSLREDANRMLTALISAAPSPLSAPSLSRDSAVGFGDLPGAAPDFEGSDVVGHIPNLVDLVEKVSELRSQLEIKASELAELRGAVLNHNNTLQKLSNGSVKPNQTNFHQTLETLVESKMSEARVAILDGFEKRVENAEDQCVSRLSEVRLQCKEELEDGQDQIEQMMNIKANGLKTELQKLQARLQNLEPDEGCCIAMSGLTERVVYLEQSVGGLNDSQGHLRAELGGHKDHVEGMLEGRLGYVEEKMVAFSQTGASGSKTLPSDLEAELDRRLKAIETRLLNAVEELGNATSPALLEGQAVPTLETEVEVLRKKVEDELHRLQQQFKSLEVLCTSACASQPVLTGYAATTAPADRRSEENREELHERLELQVQRMSQLNATLTSLLAQLAEKQQDFIQGEVTLLKVSVNSVNRSICGLQESLGSVIREVSHSNLTWQEREDRLAQQVKGVVQLVGRQASMLGTGDRRLTRLKGELQDLRRRVTGELQGCRSTALGVQKEVSEVGGRVARVEGQCGGLAHLADDLERIRGELERHSDGYLAQVNTTLVDHSKQLSELRNGLQNCTGAYADGAGDKMLTTAQYATEEEAHPRGDQFAVPSQHRGD